MNQKTIVVVDDNPLIIGLLREALEEEGWTICSAANGFEGLEVVRKSRPDLVLLDINMPGMNGFEFCRQVNSTPNISIIMLTARGEIADIDDCFNLGAVGYITKPFRTGEVIARVKMELRRQDHIAQTKDVCISGELVIDSNAKAVRRKGERVQISPKEYFLLETLASHPGEALSNEQLLHQVWGANYGQENNYVQEHIRRLRAKLEPSQGNPIYITTVPGIGYRFEAEPEKPSSS